MVFAFAGDSTMTRFFAIDDVSFLSSEQTSLYTVRTQTTEILP
jgi:hypothetical protein